MDSPMRILATAALVLALSLSGCNEEAPTTPHKSGSAPTAPGPTSPASEPEEDEPGFDCRIHGNRQCGPPNQNA